jgi:3-(3-hydroxy-phenyl)propionate hydroxylase
MEALSSVLVAGGGAVGLTTALALARAGVPVTVFEAAAELVEEYRASTFHPPTLEMLDDLGLAKGMIESGLIARTFQYRDQKEGLVAEFDLGLLANDTRFPFRLQLEQYALSVAAYEVLRSMPNVDVRFAYEVMGVRHEGDSVVATVNTPEGQREFSAPYVIGADGAASAVRRSMDITFEGMTYPDRYMMLFSTFDFSDKVPGLGPVNYVSAPERWCLFLRSPGLWRISFPTKPEEIDQESAIDELVQNQLRYFAGPHERYPLHYQMLYTVHQRVAGTYRIGRVLLAGDAAHVNNPLGGMGLNGGIHDAVNLAEGLAKVWRGQVSDSALNDYAEHRRRIAVESVQAWTHQNETIFGQTDPEVRRQQQQEFRDMAADPIRARRYLLRTSMIQMLRPAVS